MATSSSDPYLTPEAVPARVREQLAFTILVQCHAPEDEPPRATGQQCLACPHFRGVVRVVPTLSGDATKDYRGRCDAPRGREVLPFAQEGFVRCPEASAKVPGASRHDAISTSHCRGCEYFRGLHRPQSLVDRLLLRPPPPPRIRCVAPRGVQYVPLHR